MTPYNIGIVRSVVGTIRAAIVISVVMISCLFPLQSLAASSQSLFIIERSKNANVVHYDVKLDDAGDPVTANTIDAYWIRHAGAGNRKELEWFERNWAYGAEVIGPVSANGFSMTVKSYDQREISVRRVDGQFEALIEIVGEMARLEKIYVVTDESGLIPKVLYIELNGINVENGEQLVERITND